MAISRSEMKEYFEIFGIFVDDDGLRLSCFLCGQDLKYNRSRYYCSNDHRYSYEDMVYQHAGYLSHLTKEVSEDTICNQ